MNNDYQKLSSSHTDVTGNSDYHPSIETAAVYSLLPSEHPESIQINPSATLGEKPVQCTCTQCHTLILTRVYQTPGLLSWMFCFVLILFGCWLGCCLIPFCISDIQNTQHYCPNCQTFLGEYRPI